MNWREEEEGEGEGEGGGGRGRGRRGGEQKDRSERGKGWENEDYKKMDELFLTELFFIKICTQFMVLKQSYLITLKSNKNILVYKKTITQSGLKSDIPVN